MKIGSFAIKFSKEKRNSQLKYIIINEFEDIVLKCFYHVIPLNDENVFIISLIKY